MTLKSTIGAVCAASLAVCGISAAHAQPVAHDNAAPNPAMKSPDHMTKAPLAKGANSFTQGEAKSRLEKAGYANVSDLNKDADGLWQASATRHGKPVKVALDYKGNVATR